EHSMNKKQFIFSLLLMNALAIETSLTAAALRSDFFASLSSKSATAANVTQPSAIKETASPASQANVLDVANEALRALTHKVPYENEAAGELREIGNSITYSLATDQPVDVEKVLARISKTNLRCRHDIPPMEFEAAKAAVSGLALEKTVFQGNLDEELDRLQN